MQDKIEIVVVGKSGCVGCIQQKQLMQDVCIVNKVFYDSKSEKDFAKSKYGVIDEDSVPVYILFVNGKEIYRNYVPISPQRLELELNKIK
jgi:hypothetical protein